MTIFGVDSDRDITLYGFLKEVTVCLFVLVLLILVLPIVFLIELSEGTYKWFLKQSTRMGDDKLFARDTDKWRVRMKGKMQNIEIDVNVGEVLEQIETEYLLHELSRRLLLYTDIISLIRDTLDEDELKTLKKEVHQMIKVTKEKQ